MKRLLILMILLSSCTTIPKEVVIESELYDAHCQFPLAYFQEYNVLLVSYDRNHYKVRAADGNMLGIPVNSCILSKVKDIDFKVKKELNPGGVRSVDCYLGDLKLITKDLWIDGETKDFWSLIREDGKNWIVPKKRCSLFYQKNIENNNLPKL